MYYYNRLINTGLQPYFSQNPNKAKERGLYSYSATVQLILFYFSFATILPPEPDCTINFCFATILQTYSQNPNKAKERGLYSYSATVQLILFYFSFATILPPEPEQGKGKRLIRNS